MREDNLLAVQPRAFVVTTNSEHEFLSSLHIAMSHQCFDRECVITGDIQPRTKCGSEIMPFDVTEVS